MRHTLPHLGRFPRWIADGGWWVMNSEERKVNNKPAFGTIIKGVISWYCTLYSPTPSPSPASEGGEPCKTKLANRNLLPLVPPPPLAGEGLGVGEFKPSHNGNPIPLTQRGSWVLRLLVVSCLLLAGGLAQAQVVTDNTAPAADSALKVQNKKIKPAVVQLNLPALYRGLPARDSLRPQLADVLHWDELDTLPGFLQTLGLIGKPYRQFRYGLPVAYDPDNVHYLNPAGHQASVYILNAATQQPLHDTRTPYIDLYFAQPTRQTQLTSVRVSQNISPYYNATLHYRRRTAVGPYLNMRVDHYNIGFGQYFRTKNTRYQGLLNLAYNQLRDNLNGGVLRDSLSLYDELFDKLAENVTLSGARLSQRVRTAHTYHQYRLLGQPGTPGELTLLGHATLTEHLQTYTGPADSLALQAVYGPYRPYAALQDDYPSGISQGFTAVSLQAGGGVRLAFGLGKYRLGLQGEVDLYNRSFGGQNFDTTLTTAISQLGQTNYLTLTPYSADTTVAADSALVPFRADFRLRHAYSNVFSPELTLSGRALWQWGLQPFYIVDSTARDTSLRRTGRAQTLFYYKGVHAPVSLSVSGLWASVNPSPQMRYWQGATFAGNPNLGNERVLRLQGAIQWTARPTVNKGLPYQQAFARVGAFYSSQGAMIYLGQDGTTYQLPDGAALNWAGITLAGRLGVGRLYAEADGTLQAAFSTGPVTWQASQKEQFTQMQPNLMATLRVYYENWAFKRAALVRLGLDVVSHSTFRPQSLDPATLLYFPTLGDRLPGYDRLDAHATMQIGQAYIFVQLRNVLDGIGQAGYVTTSFYPMLERTFVFGVRWRFFN